MTPQPLMLLTTTLVLQRVLLLSVHLTSDLVLLLPRLTQLCLSALLPWRLPLLCLLQPQLRTCSGSLLLPSQLNLLQELLLLLPGAGEQGPMHCPCTDGCCDIQHALHTCHFRVCHCSPGVHTR